MKAKEEYRLGGREKICYSMGDCAGQIYVALASYFLTGYYTDTVGIAAMAVGTMMLVARIFDGTSDLIMGAIVDKTNTKYGKARPWILWTAPLMAVGLFALFNVPAGMSDGGKLVYAYITYILLNCIIYTANGIAYNSLLCRMTFDVQDRASTTSLRFVLGTVTTLIINAITANLVTSIGWGTLVAIYAAVELVLLLICFFGCKEHIGDTGESEKPVEKIPLNIAFPALLKNQYFFMQAFMMIFLYINIISVGSMTYYFCSTVLGNLGAMTVVTMAYNIPTIIGSFINPSLVARFGKRKTLIACFLLSAAGRMIVGFGGTSIPVVLVGVAIHGLALGPIYSDVFAMTADIVDYGEWKTGVRSEGLVTCCVSFGMKVGIGLGGVVATWALALGGYIEGAEAALQPASAVASIQFGFGYLSAILSVIGLVIAFMMNLDKDIAKIQSDLTAKHRA